MNMKLKPRGDKLYVEILKLAEEKTEGGKGMILIPETSEKDRPVFGRVLGVGEGRYEELAPGVHKLIPLKTTIGTVVLFNKYSGMKFRINDLDYICLRESEVIMEADNFPFTDEQAPEAPELEPKLVDVSVDPR